MGRLNMAVETKKILNDRLKPLLNDEPSKSHRQRKESSTNVGVKSTANRCVASERIRITRMIGVIATMENSVNHKIGLADSDEFFQCERIKEGSAKTHRQKGEVMKIPATFSR